MEKKLQTVRKLLAKAERAGTPEEAEAFRAKATELMMRYSIDEAMLGAKHESDDKIGSRRFVLTHYPKPKAQMLSWIGDAFGCKTIRLGGESSAGRSVCVMYGWESDLAAIEVLFSSLQVQALREAKWAHAQEPWINGRTFMTSFLVGFASTVGQRLQQQRRRVTSEADQGTPGTALVLVDRSKRVQQHFQQEHPRIRTMAGSTVRGRGAYHAGKQAGQRADLGQGHIGGQGKAIAR